MYYSSLTQKNPPAPLYSELKLQPVSQGASPRVIRLPSFVSSCTHTKPGTALIRFVLPLRCCFLFSLKCNKITAVFIGNYRTFSKIIAAKWHISWCCHPSGSHSTVTSARFSVCCIYVLVLLVEILQWGGSRVELELKTGNAKEFQNQSVPYMEHFNVA